ncbi:MAG: SDR family NAD(P)-dependent oxidoreductase [Eggerthellaceae bacterium]
MHKNKAVVVGGSSGVGLAISSLLIRSKWNVVIIDRELLPDEAGLPMESVEYFYSDLLNYNDDLFAQLAQDGDIKCLFIAAGIGRVCLFEHLHIAEIEKTLTINSLAAMKILKQFYKRIRSDEEFYCGVMCSISGHVSSPAFSVYAASKAAVCRFVESVNAELEYEGVKNRVLDVSPGSIGGTRFYGSDETRLDQLEPLAKDILMALLRHDNLLIPDYEDTYKEVLDRYQADPRKFGLQSAEYKMASSRIDNRATAKIGYLSGTFDLFHIGHLNLLKRAKRACDYLVVGVHPSGAWKGKETFIPFEERKEILRAIRCVDKVIDAPDEDSDAWETVGYNLLFVGSDYQGTDRFKRYEVELGAKGVRIIYFPYTQTTSSTELRRAIKDSFSR